MQERANRAFSGQLPNMENETPFEQSRQIFDPNFWGPILFAMIIGFGFYFIYKKTSLFKRQPNEEMAEAGFVTTVYNEGEASIGGYSRRQKPVLDNDIRKEIFQLEKYAHKKELGRLNHEDVKEWFDRLNLQYDPRTVLTYERVRYGEQFVEITDGWFKDEIKKVKKQISALEKLKKEESKKGLKENFKHLFRR